VIQTLTIVLSLLLAGCGAEVAGTAAVSGVTRAQEAQQVRQQLDQFQQRLDTANQVEQQQRDAAERANGL